MDDDEIERKRTELDSLRVKARDLPRASNFRAGDDSTLQARIRMLEQDLRAAGVDPDA